MFPADQTTTDIVAGFPSPPLNPPVETTVPQSTVRRLTETSTAGIAVGVVGGAAAIIVLLVWWWRHRKPGRKDDNVGPVDDGAVKAELDGDETSKKRQEPEATERQELEGAVSHEVGGKETQELEAVEREQELDGHGVRLDQRTDLLLSRAASGMRHARSRSGGAPGEPFEME